MASPIFHSKQHNYSKNNKTINKQLLKELQEKILQKKQQPQSLDLPQEEVLPSPLTRRHTLPLRLRQSQKQTVPWLKPLPRPPPSQRPLLSQRPLSLYEPRQQTQAELETVTLQVSPPSPSQEAIPRCTNSLKTAQSKRYSHPVPNRSMLEDLRPAVFTPGERKMTSPEKSFPTNVTSNKSAKFIPNENEIRQNQPDFETARAMFEKSATNKTKKYVITERKILKGTSLEEETSQMHQVKVPTQIQTTEVCDSVEEGNLLRNGLEPAQEIVSENKKELNTPHERNQNLQKQKHLRTEPTHLKPELEIGNLERTKLKEGVNDSAALKEQATTKIEDVSFLHAHVVEAKSANLLHQKQFETELLSENNMNPISSERSFLTNLSSNASTENNVNRTEIEQVTPSSFGRRRAIFEKSAISEVQKDLKEISIEKEEASHILVDKVESVDGAVLSETLEKTGDQITLMKKQYNQEVENLRSQLREDQQQVYTISESLEQARVFQEELAAKRDEVMSLHAQLAKTREQNIQELEELRMKLVDKEAEIDRIKLKQPEAGRFCAEISALQKQLVTKDTDVTSLYAQLAKTRSKNLQEQEQLRTDLLNTRAQLELFKADHPEVKQLRSDFETSQKKLVAAKKKILFVNAELEKARTDSQQEKEQLRKDLADTRAQLELFKADHTEVKQLRANFEISQKELLAKNEKIFSVNAELEKARTDSQQEKEQLRKDLADTRAQLELLKVDHPEVKQLRANFEISQKELIAKNEKIFSVNAELEKARTDSQQEKKQLRKDLADTRAQLEVLKADHPEVKQLRSDFETSQKELVAAKKKILFVNAELEKARTDSHQEKEQLRKDLADTRAQLELLKADHTEVKQRRADFQTSQNDFVKYNEKLACLTKETAINQKQQKKEQPKNLTPEAIAEVSSSIIDTNELKNCTKVNKNNFNDEQSALSAWVIDRYEIVMTEQVIVEGSWGNVKVGRLQGNGVAVKKINSLILSSDNRERFELDVTIASHCCHSCLVKFIGATNEDGVPLFVMELLESDLRSLLSRESLGNRDCLQIGFDTICALNYLHRWKPAPIIHSDVTSSNIMLYHDGDGWRGKLAGYEVTNSSRLFLMQHPGTSLYCAPEAAINQTPKLDVYSFGVLFCEMCTRELPAPEQREEQVNMVTNTAYKSLIEDCLKTCVEDRIDSENVLSRFERWRFFRLGNNGF